MLLKRIIGLPGETVAFVNGRVLINGEILDEPYEKLDVTGTARRSRSAPINTTSSATTVPCRTEYHTHGIYQRSRIVGKARL